MTSKLLLLWVRKLRYGKVKGLAEITHLGSSRAEIQTQVTDSKVLVLTYYTLLQY